MRVLLYADLRTHHALSWLDGLQDAGVEVCAVSSQVLEAPAAYPFAPDPVSRLRSRLVAGGLNRRVRSVARAPGGAGESPLQVAETALTPLRLRSQAALLRREAAAFRPDLVHALRVPYEGLIALTVVRDRPVVVSTWGQDFSLQAAHDPLLRRWIRRVLPRAAGLHVDAQADVARAVAHGFVAERPTLFAAGNFGVDGGLFHPEPSPDGEQWVVYPRGRRRYVHHRCFLAMVEAAGSDPALRFVGVGLTGDEDAERVAEEVGSRRLWLTPELPRADFAAILRRASVVVSPSTSDGTPNSLLEALACGAHVMAGDIPSVRAFLADEPDAVLLDPLRPEAWVAHLARWRESSGGRRGEHPGLPEPFDRDANLVRVPDFYAQVRARR